MSSVLFIGLGNMGLPMAANLKNKKFSVTGFDISQNCLQSFSSQGGQVAESLDILKTQSFDFIISMLPSGNHVKNLFTGEQGIFPNISPSSLIIDCSTIDIKTSQEISSIASTKKLKILDAPVSGGTKGATEGNLTFIVGGELADLKKAEPVLQAMGKKIFHAGAHGLGQAAKMCNNMLLATHMIGTAEAIKLGEKVGLSSKVLSEIMGSSSGKNWSLEFYNPCPGVMEGVPSSNSYKGGFAVDLMVKDLTLAKEAQKKFHFPLAEKVFDIYKKHQKKGWGKKDFSSIFKADL